MRLLHTSDWHLGRSFHREDMLAAQGAFIDFLVATVESEGVDAVVVSGDIYDRALPAVDAVALCNEALTRLAGTRARVILISGNHDSATRLGFSSGLIDTAGIHLRTDPRGCATPVLLDDQHGSVAVYALPYLEPAAVDGFMSCDDRTHRGVLSAAMDAVRHDLSARRAHRSVVLAHASVLGGQASDSERDISVGGVSAVAPAIFHGIDYVALGHLHGAQQLSDRVRYSGSPLAYSFSEEHQRKGMWLVEVTLRRGDSLPAEFIPTPVPRPLARLRGSLDHFLTDPSLTRYGEHYLQITLTDAVRPREPMERLRRRFPHLLLLAFDPEGGDTTQPVSYAARLRERSDIDLAGDFITHVRSPAEADELDLIQQAFEAVRQREAIG